MGTGIADKKLIWTSKDGKLRTIRITHRYGKHDSFYIEEHYLDKLDNDSWKVVCHVDDEQSYFYKMLKELPQPAETIITYRKKD